MARFDLDAELVALATMSPAQLRSKWETMVRRPIPRISEGMLRMALGYEMQAKALGGLSREVRRVLDDRVAGRRRSPPVLPGTRIAREWQGTVHIVTRRYRYYVSRGLQHRHEEIEGSGMRIPAREIEGAVIERLAAAFDEPLTLAANIGWPFDGIDLSSMGAGASDTAARVRLRNVELVRRLIVRIRVDAADARIQLSTAAMAEVLKTGVTNGDPIFERHLGAKLTRSGRAMRCA